MRVLSVLGGRPHLVKAESVHIAFADSPSVRHETVECWQGVESDYPGSSDQDFDLPEPLRRIRRPTVSALAGELDEAIGDLRPDVVLAYGDLRASALAAEAALVRNIPVVHVEAGYRSGDRADREEETRVFLDHVARHRVAHSKAMHDNLVFEGIDPATISIFGDCALQTLGRRLRNLVDEDMQYSGTSGRGLVTLHRPENLADADRVRQVVDSIITLGTKYDIHFITYGTTKRRLAELDLLDDLANAGISVKDTMPYDGYVRELLEASFIVTDSSGLQDESAFLQKPCFVLRRATPRRERLGKQIRLIDPTSSPSAVVSSVSRAVSAGWGQGPDHSLLGRPYDNTFLDVISSLV